jgi:hypothetical protein
MTIRLYFETLSPGLHARLDARYRMNRKPGRIFQPGVVRTRFASGGFIPTPVEVLQVPTTPAR